MVFPQHWRSSSNGVFICVQPIARLKFVADLTDEKDSDPLVVGVVQLLTIVVSFAAMTLVRGNITGLVPKDLKVVTQVGTMGHMMLQTNRTMRYMSNHILAMTLKSGGILKEEYIQQ